MPENRVTCVIPTHLRPDLLGEALDCIRHQALTTTPTVIVVDDADDPQTRAVVHAADAQSPGPVIYLARSDGAPGASGSRNAGAHHGPDASEFLAFLDDDDLWTPQFLPAALRALDEDPGAAMAITGLDVQEVTGAVRPLARMPRGLGHRQISRDNPGFTGSNFVIRRSVFGELGGFDAELTVSNDKDLLVRFLRGGHRYVTVPEGLCLHRHHAGDRLTDLNTRRADGLDRYVRKHRQNMPLADALLLRSRASMIRSRVTDRKLASAVFALRAIFARAGSIVLTALRGHR